MSIGETVSRLLLKRLVDDVFATGGVEALDAVIDFLTRSGRQDDPRLAEALKQAMQRAWQSLEAALSGEPCSDPSQVGLAPRAAQGLRQGVERLLAELVHGGRASGRPTSLVVVNALRRQCLDDLRRARAGDALAGCLDGEEWARSNEVFVRFAANQGRRDTRQRTQGQLLRDLEQHGCVGLMRLLTGAAGLPLLLMTARAFLCQELTRLLYRCLQDSPEQTPDNCSVVLDILQELSSPRFTLLRAPARVAASVHWSRLEIGSERSVPSGVSRFRVPRPSVATKSAPRPRQRATAATSRASWALAAVLTIAAALLVVLPLWLLVENARHSDDEAQRATAQRQRLLDERRRVDAERQRLIDEQRQLEREEAARQLALQRQREEAERRRRIEAEEERQRAEDLAAEQLQEQRRRLAEERRARLREEQQRILQARLSLDEGLTRSALRQDREALTTLSESLRLDPNLLSAWSARGVVRRRLGDAAGALEDFHEAVRRDPQDVRSWLQCAELHADRQEHGQAIAAFTAVLRLQPNNLEAYRQRGLCYSRNHEIDKAIADETKVIDLAPDDPWAYYYRANLHRLRNDLDRAVSDYTAAIDRNRSENRGLAGAYRGRGMLYLHWQQYEPAIKDLSQALDLDPRDTDAQRARGTAYLRNCDWNHVLLDADGLIRHDADDIAAYKMRGQAYMGLAEYERAHEDFTQVLRRRREAETYYLRARAKVHLGDIQEAIFDCNDATAINPRLACAFYLRGRLNLRSGYRISGMDDCRIAHELDPQYPMP